MYFYQKQNSHIPYNYNAYEYSDISFPAHIHADLELIYVKEKVSEIIVDNRQEILGEGEALLILPNQVHGIQVPADGVAWVGVFSKDYVPEFGRIIKGKICRDNRLVLDEWDREILIEKLINTQPGRLELCAYLMSMCAVFMRSRSEDDLQDAAYTKRELLFHQMLSYIAEHYKENITLKEMAEALGYEEHYMSRCFSTCFHTNFKQLVNEYRIQYARQLIAESENRRTMTEIAYMSGFQSVRNFNRAYRRVSGGQPRNEKG